MLIISQEAFNEMAALRRADYEVPFIVKTIRERGDPLAQGLAGELLRREVRETLATCDRLELTGDVDRLAFCMLEITCLAGLRDIPKLAGLLDYSDGSADARIQALLAKMPPPVWQQLSQAAPDVQAKRGWE